MWRTVCRGPFCVDDGSGFGWCFWIIEVIWVWVVSRRLMRGGR